jgi:hypothetical protein
VALAGIRPSKSTAAPDPNDYLDMFLLVEIGDRDSRNVRKSPLFSNTRACSSDGVPASQHVVRKVPASTPGQVGTFLSYSQSIPLRQTRRMLRYPGLMQTATQEITPKLLPALNCPHAESLAWIHRGSAGLKG